MCMASQRPREVSVRTGSWHIEQGTGGMEAVCPSRGSGIGILRCRNHATAPLLHVSLGRSCCSNFGMVGPLTRLYCMMEGAVAVACISTSDMSSRTSTEELILAWWRRHLIGCESPPFEIMKTCSRNFHAASISDTHSENKQQEKW